MHVFNSVIAGAARTYINTGAAAGVTDILAAVAAIWLIVRDGAAHAR
jgi:hypothetical protein